MLSTIAKVLAAGSLALLLANCGESSNLPTEQTQGPNPTLPEPHKSLIPIVHIAPARLCEKLTQSAALVNRKRRDRSALVRQGSQSVLFSK